MFRDQVSLRVVCPTHEAVYMNTPKKRKKEKRLLITIIINSLAQNLQQHNHVKEHDHLAAKAPWGTFNVNMQKISGKTWKQSQPLALVAYL